MATDRVTAAVIGCISRCPSSTLRISKCAGRGVGPELVSTHEADGYQQVNYDGLAAIAIAGVQQLRRELEAVRERLDRIPRDTKRRTAARRRSKRHHK